MTRHCNGNGLTPAQAIHCKAELQPAERRVNDQMELSNVHKLTWIYILDYAVPNPPYSSSENCGVCRIDSR